MEVGEVKAKIQVSKKEFYTYIRLEHLDYIRV